MSSSDADICAVSRQITWSYIYSPQLVEEFVLYQGNNSGLEREFSVASAGFSHFCMTRIAGKTYAS